MVFISTNKLRHELTKYKDYKLKGRANSAEYDSYRHIQNTNNRLMLSSKIKKYLLNKYGTLTDLSNYNFDDTQLFIEFMEFQGYSTGFIKRTYNVEKSKINWDNIPTTSKKFWDNIDWEKFWDGEYNNLNKEGGNNNVVQKNYWSIVNIRNNNSINGFNSNNKKKK